MPSAESRIKNLERVVEEREKNKSWPDSWSKAAQAVHLRITLAELDWIRQEMIDDNAWRKRQDEEAGRPVWGAQVEEVPADWRAQMTLEELAKSIPADRPKVRAFILAESIDHRKLQFLSTIREWFSIGPVPPEGAQAGIDEEDFFASIEKVMDLERSEWNTPLPIVREHSRGAARV
jgi:hypothetical protein